jgi:hypothetical protein
MISARPLLCPNGSQTGLEPWAPSTYNTWWSPKLATYPSTSEFLPGDILLFWPLNPTLLQSQVVAHQRRRGHAVEHASFTHAAIWVGIDHLLCDATPKLNVHVNSLEDYLKKRDTCLLVRRVPAISEVQRVGIARAAVNYRGGKYSFKTIIQDLWPQLLGRMRDPELDEETQRGLVCSTLCARAVAIGTQSVSLLPSDKGLAIPATLSASAKLEDRIVQWREVA